MPKMLLKVENLQTRFRSLKAVRGVSFAIDEGSVLGIVGESGSGKSVTALSIMRLIESPGEINGGKVVFHDDGKETDLLALSDKQLEKILGNRVSMIFQDPMTSLNPVLSIGYQIAETLRVHRGLSKKDAKRQAVNLLRRVGIANAERRINDYPHEFSGGMRQRVMIAMAVACEPKLLIADEPTTALDVTIQAQILALLREFKRELGMSIIIITHDLGVVANVADRVAVMYAGEIVENAPVELIFNRPQHPYTRALIASIPNLYEQPARLQTIEGAPPSLTENHRGCSFFERCADRMTGCAAESPVLTEINAGHFVSCLLTQNGAFANV
jgi:peptide/nickel transport system ATP-binding protein